jgi:hypothetical protein
LLLPKPNATHPQIPLKTPIFRPLLLVLWIPFSAMCLEERKTVKRVLAVVAFVGLAGGATAYLPVVARPDVLVTSVMNHSIQYNIVRSPAFDTVRQALWHLAYLAVVAFPLFI